MSQGRKQESNKEGKKERRKERTLPTDDSAAASIARTALAKDHLPRLYQQEYKAPERQGFLSRTEPGDVFGPEIFSRMTSEGVDLLQALKYANTPPGPPGLSL